MSAPLEEAAAWRARLTEAGIQSSGAFEFWLATDPDNQAAWASIQDSWSLFGQHAAAPKVVELRRAALSSARAARESRRFRAFKSSTVQKFAVAAAVLLTAAATLLVWRAQQPDVYRTAAGERRVVTLADGSQVSLDSRTEVHVKYSATARDLTLYKGQARFDVTHDVERPFSVRAGTEKVIATGTAFNVDLMGSKVLVTLIEGRVLVLEESSTAIAGSARGAVPAPVPMVVAARGSSPPEWPVKVPPVLKGIELNAGEQLTVSPASAPDVEPVSVDRATAWQNGLLIFENERLASVIARFNRYTDRPILLADDASAELRISGVFHTGDVDGFVSIITDYLPVLSAREQSGAIRLTHR
jgi:transmembrane sensor